MASSGNAALIATFSSFVLVQYARFQCRNMSCWEANTKRTQGRAIKKRIDTIRQGSEETGLSREKHRSIVLTEKTGVDLWP